MYRVLLFAALSACSPYAPDLGNAPYLCASAEPQCPDGYTCELVGSQNVCVDGDGVGPRTDSGTPGEAGPPREAGPPGEAGSCTSSFTGVLAIWMLTGQAGSQTSTPAAMMAAGVTASDLKRGGSLTPTSGTNSINSSGWSTGALDQTKFYTIALTPPSDCAISVTSLALDASASGTGPTSAAVATGADLFASTTPASTTTAGAVALTATESGTLEIRVYGLGATASTGTMRIQNTLSVTGSVQ